MKKNWIKLTFLTIFLITATYCSQDKNQKLSGKEFQFRIITEAITNNTNPYFVDTLSYPKKRESLPIGIFDSGTGGLSVLNTILELDEFNNRTHEPGSDSIPDFATERFIYLADEANMPYGKYNAEGKADFLRELVLKDVLFLLGNQYYFAPDDHSFQTDKVPVKNIVIACNTATAFGLETVREAMDHWGLGIEITGIIEAGAKSALSKIQNINQERSAIGVLATEGTVASGGYPETIKKIISTMNPDMNIQILQQAGIGLAGAIDGDINYMDPLASSTRDTIDYFGPEINHSDYPIDLALWGEYNFENDNALFITVNPDRDTVSVQLNSVTNYIRYMVTHLIHTATMRCPDYRMNTVILGCTHYPYVQEEIYNHFLYLRKLNEKYNQIIPEDLLLIDPAKALAIGLYEDLRESNLFGNDFCSNSQFYISVPNYLFMKNQIDENGEFPYSWKYGRDYNTLIQFVKFVPFSEKWIDKSIRKRIEENIPTTYQIISF